MCFIILIFFTIPLAVDLTNEKIIFSKNYENNSKNNLKKVLEKQNLKIDDGLNKIDDGLNNEFLFDDVLSFDEQPQDSVRLSAATIEELFKSTNYSLDDVRKNKLVKPVALDSFPLEIKMIENTKKRKELFLQIVLPLVLQENNNIRLDRKRLFSIINKSKNTNLEKKWLQKKYKQYGVPSKDLSILKIRMDEVPVSLALAQAAKETGWGTSRFAQEGNALFGQWTWSGEGIKPLQVEKNKKHKVAKFKILKASVRAYQRNLNTHSSYKEFRIERAIQRDNDEKLDSLKLVNFLEKYAETGKEYTEVLKKIINQNSLTDFDDVNILPTSLKMKNLI